jgi:uncharacterized protein (DUF983 family)
MKGSYFKRIKEPARSTEHVRQMRTETKIYFIISIVGAVALGLVIDLFPQLTLLIQILILVAVSFAIYFGIMLTALSHVKVAVSNLSCDSCHAALDGSSCVNWEELDRHWRATHVSNRLRGKLYVRIRFTCQCPRCGHTKVFTETLCSGQLRITRYCSLADIMPAQALVDDYFNKLIHK